MVLEWASDNNEIDLLREKAKRNVEPFKDVPKNKKIKFNHDKSGRQQGDCWISNAGWTHSFPARCQCKVVPQNAVDIAGSGFAARERQSDRKDSKDLEDSTHASVTRVHSMHLIHTFY